MVSTQLSQEGMIQSCSFALGTAFKHRVENFLSYLVPPTKRVGLPDPAEDGIGHHLISPTPKCILNFVS